MARVIHFEIPTKEPEKAKQFFQKVFGWEIERWGEIPYWLITTGKQQEPGINGALMLSKKDHSGIINTISVVDIDETTKAIRTAGGEVLQEKMAVPGIGWHIYFRDLDGNILGAKQEDPEVK